MKIDAWMKTVTGYCYQLWHWKTILQCSSPCGFSFSADNISDLFIQFSSTLPQTIRFLGELTINKRITTALLLAAGTGSRLRPLTLDAPKCLTEVGGEAILGRLVDSLRLQGIKRLVVVTGYLDHCIRDFLEINAADLQVDTYLIQPTKQLIISIRSGWRAK